MQRQRSPNIPNPDGRTFHRLTQQWWRNVWTSPMASEYLETDVDGLGRLALLIDDYHRAADAKERKELMTEIRLQEARFGLSPIDRSRLQWEVAKGEEAGRRRQQPAQATPSKPHPADPRGVLGVVK